MNIIYLVESWVQFKDCTEVEQNKKLFLTAVEKNHGFVILNKYFTDLL